MHRPNSYPIRSGRISILTFSLFDLTFGFDLQLQRQPAFPFALLFIWASASGVAILRVCVFLYTQIPGLHGTILTCPSSSCAILFYSPLNMCASPH